MIVVRNGPIQDHFSKVSIYNLSENIKKEYIEMTKKIYLETFEKCPGSVHFSLLSQKMYLLYSQIPHLRNPSEF